MSQSFLCLFITFACYESIGWNEMSQEAGMQMGRGPAWPRECPQVAPILSLSRETSSPAVPIIPATSRSTLASSSVWELEKGVPRAGIHPEANQLKAREEKVCNSWFSFLFLIFQISGYWRFKKQVDLAASHSSFCPSCILLLERTSLCPGIGMTTILLQSRGLGLHLEFENPFCHLIVVENWASP